MKQNVNKYGCPAVYCGALKYIGKEGVVMSGYSWKNHWINFGSQQEMHHRITKIFIRHGESVQKNFKTRYNTQVKGRDQNAVLTMSALAYEVLEEEIESIKKEVKAEQLYIPIDNICNENEEAIYWEVLLITEQIVQDVDEIEAFREYEKERRNLRKQYRGQWVGGGFGFRGAIVGAAKAGVLNAATGMAASAFNAAGNFGTSIKTNQQIGKTLDDGYDAILQALSNGLAVIYQQCLERKGIDQLYTPDMMEKNARTLEKYKDSDDISAAGYLFANIQNNPYNREQYQVLIKRYGDEEGIFKKIGDSCGIDTDKMKRDILIKECEKFKDYDNENLGRDFLFILNRKKELGYVGEIQKEASIKRKLKENPLVIVKYIIKQMDVDDRKSLDIGFQQLKTIKGELDIESNTFKSLVRQTLELPVLNKQNLLKNVRLIQLFQKDTETASDELNQLYTKAKEFEEQQRTVGGVLFDSVEAADEEREHYVGDIRYETVEEAKEVRIKQKQEKEAEARKIAEQKAQEAKKEEYGKKEAVWSLICTIITWLFTPWKRFSAVFATAGIILGFISLSHYKTKKAWFAIIWSFLLLLPIFTGGYDEQENDTTISLSENQEQQTEKQQERMENPPAVRENQTEDREEWNKTLAEWDEIFEEMSRKYNYILPNSDKQFLTENDISHLSKIEKWIAGAEILARHGLVFSDINDLGYTQKYFDQKKWYTPEIEDADFDYTELNKYEAYNFILLGDAYKSDEEFSGAPNLSIINIPSEELILPESSSRYLTLDDLTGLSKQELRLARNEIYAKHGRKFETEDLNQYFSSKSWYQGYLSLEEFDDSVLNEYEKANLDLIKNAEGIGEAQAKPEWVGTYISEDDQTIAISSADANGVLLTFAGYSEEGWYTHAELLPYTNNEKNQVSYKYYYEGKLVQETFYTLIDIGIKVEVKPAGGSQEGVYLRQ